ncbi:hypothetical protein FB451DRAFT_1561766 [Mycena latifolia]|nr:hypothetical protein FB451DRAFT_1561766 [Mycena latifolia]
MCAFRGELWARRAAKISSSVYNKIDRVEGEEAERRRIRPEVERMGMSTGCGRRLRLSKGRRLWAPQTDLEREMGPQRRARCRPRPCALAVLPHAARAETAANSPLIALVWLVDDASCALAKGRAADGWGAWGGPEMRKGSKPKPTQADTATSDLHIIPQNCARIPGRGSAVPAHQPRAGRAPLGAGFQRGTFPRIVKKRRCAILSFRHAKLADGLCWADGHSYRASGIHPTFVDYSPG